MGDNINEKDTKDSNPNEKSKEKQIHAIISELNDLINEIRSSRQINDVIVQSQTLNLNQLTQSQITSNGTTEDQDQSSSPDQGTAQNQAPNAIAGTQNASVTIIQTAATLAAINSIKTELCKLPLNFCEREYIASCVNPLETAIELLSRTSFDLATSVSVLSSSAIVPRKKGKIKDTIHTIYVMNEEVEDLYKILKGRLKRLTNDEFCCEFLGDGCGS